VQLELALGPDPKEHQSHEDHEHSTYETDQVVITGGVEEGAKVVTLGVQKLDPAQKVRVVSSLSF
jgi:hypothetical protein